MATRLGSARRSLCHRARRGGTGLRHRADVAAGVANFVMFDLGAPVPGGPQARPYTQAEVAQLRERPLTGPGLRVYRAAVINHLAARCPVPPGLRVYDE